MFSVSSPSPRLKDKKVAPRGALWLFYRRGLGFAPGFVAFSAWGVLACAGGRRWVSEPRAAEDAEGVHLMEAPKTSKSGEPKPGGANESDESEMEYADAPGKRPLLALDGSAEAGEAPPDALFLGVFRNTYYDFPSEVDFSGPEVDLKSPSCSVVERVPKAFFDVLCVQGSGTLVSGTTVSFSSRDCACAELCPKTSQRICFDALDKNEFPWGRGAMGKPITPLKTVAVDSAVVPLGTSLYIPEFDGVARGPGGSAHDGCFVAEDRGLRVVGEHVDVFTGHPQMTIHMNQLVPSNRGVRVYARTARCQ
jgi:3D (Asp-Asp-Asp) domain-containing protein